MKKAVNDFVGQIPLSLVLEHSFRHKIFKNVCKWILLYIFAPFLLSI